MAAGDGVGFSGVLAAGNTPQQAWDTVREQFRDPSVLAALDVFRRSPHGRAMLDRSRQAWAARGLPPPWETLALPGPGTGPPGREPVPGRGRDDGSG